MINDKLKFNFKKQVPFYFQNENSDCALTCIRMLASYYGKENILEYTLDKADARKNSLSVSDIMYILRATGITPRPVGLDMDEFHQLKLPCILHWDMNHFVVLVKRKRGKYIIHDPDKGIRILSLKKISESFTGVGIEVYNDESLSPEQNRIKKNNKKKRAIYQYIISSLFSGKKILICLFILILFAEIINITIPQITQLIIDNVIVNNDHRLLITAIIFFLFLNVMSMAILATRDWLVTWLNANVGIQWSTNIYNRLMSLKTGYFLARSVGDILSRINSLEYIRNVIVSQLTKMCLDVLMAFGAFAVMLSYDIKLTLFVFLYSFLYFIVKAIYFSSLKYLNLGTISIKARQQSALIESIKYNQTIKLYFPEYMSSAAYINSMVDGINTKTKMDILNIILSSSNNFLSTLKNISILYFGGLLVINSSFTVGMLVAFIAYSEQFSRRMINIIEFIFQAGIIKIHVNRVSDICDAKCESQFSLSKPLHNTGGSVGVECNNLSVRYDNSEKNVLKNMNLIIHPGETVLLRGKSGGGKSTLLNAILGLVDLSEGSVSVTDENASNKIEFVRGISGTVLQGDTLLNGTIIYNITFNDSTPSPEVIDLTRKVGMHDIIENLPMGYFTPVNDCCNVLSAGQKQKILLARALFRNPKLLVLDEATSNLDAQSEYEINQLILSLDCTKIIVSHKNEAMSIADKIIDIDNGEIKSTTVINNKAGY
ncbi:TPA: peptidase domain-containing ABC transporter [Escherichia coli]|nr:peptidase domain-containing ABC transporter [Escherichia coli]HBN2077198.1 peptidase domain-containing ABC transporter [Escherichia coli]